jgi:N-methylhydantoinase B
MTMHGDRGDVTPFGLSGGTNGGPNVLGLRPRGDGEEVMLGMHAMGITLAPGDHVLYRSNGGGGFGSPLKRDPAMVLADVDHGWISLAKARDVYGVVLVADGDRSGALRIDAAATLKRRRELSERKIKRGYGFGEVHPLGETVTTMELTKVA